jgi:MFS family permease
MTEPIPPTRVDAGDPLALEPHAGILTPLREGLFRRVWSASLVSNFGTLIQSVGAAWAMTQMTRNADMVALVQGTSMLPLMLWSIPGGALADIYDKRKLALVGLSLSLTAAAVLTAMAASGVATPARLLIFCFLIGSGMALYTPAWQASVPEQVPQHALPHAIALNSISYSIARSFGPAIGGVIVAVAGSVAAFGANVLSYVPLIIVLLLWRRSRAAPHLPPERVGRAIVSGVRYFIHSPPIRTVLIRTFLTATLGSSASALMPLIARDLLRSGSVVYGIILGAFGIGGVLGAVLIARIQKGFSIERIVCAGASALGAAIIIVALSHWIVLTAIALTAAGAMWILNLSQFNISVQTASPRWVSGRILAAFQAAVTGGIAVGSGIWGGLAEHYGISAALFISGVLLVLSPLVTQVLRMPERVDPNDTIPVALTDPEVKLPLIHRSGPIIVEIEYEIDPAEARDFYLIMQEVQVGRQRNGAYGWTLARDLGNERLWIERFGCPTWLDYLHQRNRSTQSERRMQQAAVSLHRGTSSVRVRRTLERPVDSVEWNKPALDNAAAGVIPLS